MARVVVVSSSELPREALASAVSAEDEIHVVVPAVHQSRLRWLVSDEDDARAEAQSVGKSIARAMPGNAADVEVKPDRPEQVYLLLIIAAITVVLWLANKWVGKVT